MMNENGYVGRDHVTAGRELVGVLPAPLPKVTRLLEFGNWDISNRVRMAGVDGGRWP